ncbi:MAG: GWxTD domain-containing protein [Candidatus Eisenbacteria bacterium]|nr:GWxTD domain-containing protein [Candidatus Eisenbacteria bacterium]
MAHTGHSGWAGGRGAAPALLLALLIGCVTQAAGSEAAPPAPTLPLEATGEIHFFADGARLLDATGQPELYFTLAVPQGELVCAEREGAEGLWQELQMAVASLASPDRQVLRQGRVLRVPCDGEPVDEAAQDASARRLLYLQLDEQPGVTHFEITLEDQNAERVGLVHQMRGDKKQGRVRGAVEAGDLRDGRGLSSLIFLWTLPPYPDLEQRGAFWFGPADSLRGWLEPSPSRSYGLLNPTARFYLEAYGLDRGEVELIMRLHDPATERTLVQRAVSLRLPQPRCGILGVVDLSPFPPGSYRLEIDLAPWEETIDPFRIRGRLHLLWDPASWSRTQAELLEEVRTILPDTDRRRFTSFDPGQREAYLESLWVRLGDLPAEGNAPHRDRFRQRVRTADARYGWGQTRGASTDRGRIFIRYGAPDEVHKELIPRWRDQLFFFMRDQVDDLERSGLDPRGGLEEPSEIGAPKSERRPPIHWLDDAAYEVWTYVGAGDPLVRGWAPPSRGRALEFIFVDRLGTGDYRLVYTNVLGGR